MKFLQELLFESREDYIAQQMGPKIMAAYKRDNGLKPDFEEPLQIVKYLTKVHSKYIQWIVNQYVTGHFKLEDRTRIKDELKEFDRIKSHLDKKDITQYKTLKDLYNIVDTFKGKEVISARQLDKEIKDKGADKLIDNAQILMYEISTKEAACLLGKGTRWCTAATNDNMFDYYNKEGPLFVIIDKQDNEKYQIHLETKSCMNAYDETCRLDHIFDDDIVKQILTTLVKVNQKGVGKFLNEFDDLIPYLSEKDLLALVKRDHYSNFIYEIPRDKRTKELCLAAFNVNSTAYRAFPDKFKTLALSIQYHKENPHGDWEAIPPAHRDAVQEHDKQMKAIRSGAGMLTRSKQFRRDITDKLGPEKLKNPEVAPVIQDLDTDIQGQKTKMAGFRDYVKKIRQQKREMA